MTTLFFYACFAAAIRPMRSLAGYVWLWTGLNHC